MTEEINSSPLDPEYEGQLRTILKEEDKRQKRIPKLKIECPATQSLLDLLIEPQKGSTASKED